MWPIGGLTDSLDNSLGLPSGLLAGGFAGEDEYSRSGVRFNCGTTDAVGGVTEEGSLARRQEPWFASNRYTAYVNFWIHSDFKPYTDGSLYECRYHNVTGNTSFLKGNLTDGTWYDCDTEPEWYMELYIPPGPGGFQSWEVSGTLEVREKANTSNIASETVDLRVSGEGAT